MPATPSPVDRAIVALGQAHARLVLAVSGGLDSMVLLDRAAALLPARRLVVATFDHGTGAAARAAADHVEREATARGIAVRRGAGAALAHSEAAWRDARWTFLRQVASDPASEPGASDGMHIVTAHTADDHLETVLMRALRDAGARGLAGLHAAAPSTPLPSPSPSPSPSQPAPASAPVARPFVRISRRTLSGVAKVRGLAWVEDPANLDLRHLRNRVRHEILPALEHASPGFSAWLLGLSERAAAWRTAMDDVARRACPSADVSAGGLSVAASDLVGYHESSLAVLWASIAGRAGLALDQRGTRRLAAFTISGAPGTSIQLSGGWEVARNDGRFTLSHAGPPPPEAIVLADGSGWWGRWHFRPVESVREDSRWEAVLPAGVTLQVRGWRPADRVRRGTGRVRVKRVLTEAGIAAADRVGWPVVVADDAIVWIPGVSRMRAATARSGRPGVRIRCEPSDG